jgi:hypothetical protein
LIQTHRRQLQESGRGGGNFYGPAVTAVRRGLLAGDLECRLAELLIHCSAGERDHFSQFVQGMHPLIHRFGVIGVVPVPRGPWLHRDLEVNVTGMLGVELAAGQLEAWVLHAQAAPLDERASDTPLYVADAMLASRGSALRARVVDVRRATTFAIRSQRQRDELRCLVETEAKAYISLWRTAA